MTVRNSNILLLVLIVMLLALVYAVETMVPEVTEVPIASPRLESFFAGRVVVHLSDLHMVKMGWRERMVLKELATIKPDLILMTGDYIEQWYTDFGAFDRFLSEIASLAPVVATMGNNDYCCAKQLDSSFARAHIPLLRNQAVLLRNGYDSLYVVGLEDNFTWQDDYFAATEAVPAGAARIVLGHEPSIAEKINPDGVTLVLAGHLHGGQVMLPLIGPLAPNTACFATRAYTAGVFNVNGITLFSNRGIGTSKVPLRLLSRPEIAVLEFGD